MVLLEDSPVRTPPVHAGNRWRVPAVRDLFERQEGVAERGQLLRRGLSSSAIKRAVRSERIFEVLPGIYSLAPPALLSVDATLIAALLACGATHAMPPALGHESALWHWSLTPEAPDSIHVCSPLVVVAPAGVTVHRVGRFREDDVTLHRRLRVTTIPRSLLDVAAGSSVRRMVWLLAQAEYRHGVLPEEFAAALRRGHAGSPTLRKALDRHVPGFAKAKSNNEVRFRLLLIEAALELPEVNVEVGPFQVDCLWRAQRLIVEVDGPHHELPGQATIDAARDTWLRSQGFTVIRYSHDQIWNRSALVVEEMRRLLARPV